MATTKWLPEHLVEAACGKAFIYGILVGFFVGVAMGIIIVKLANL